MSHSKRKFPLLHCKSHFWEIKIVGRIYICKSTLLSWYPLNAVLFNSQNYCLVKKMPGKEPKIFILNKSWHSHINFTFVTYCYKCLHTLSLYCNIGLFKCLPLLENSSKRIMICCKCIIPDSGTHFLSMLHNVYQALSVILNLYID